MLASVIKQLRSAVFSLIVVTLCLCGIYLNNAHTWTHAQSPNVRTVMKILNARLASGKTVAKCNVDWKNDKLNHTFYELPKYDYDDVMVDGYLTKPVAVKPLFKNPAIPLNPNQFLMPIVFNGPNNQITGLREAIFVAIKLNRTVVLPKFKKHFTDSTRDHIFLGHRLDIDYLCKFVSCVTIEQFQKACGHQVDGVVHLRTYKSSKIRFWTSETGMQLKRIPRVKKTDPAVELIPPTMTKPKGKKALKLNSKDVRTVFKSTAKCIIYPRPLYNIHAHVSSKERLENVELVESLKDLDRLPDSRLALAIAKHTRNPTYIRELARNFVVSTTHSRPYLSVHWRYNKNDFMNRCKDNADANKRKLALCENAMLIHPPDVASSIEQRILALRSAPWPQNIRDIYIASPPSERKFVADVAKILHDKHGWITRSSLDLEKFMRSEFRSCETLQKQYFDIVSTTEMEICSISTAFLGSMRSSWTGTVHLARWTQNSPNTLLKFDGDIFELSIESWRKRSAEAGNT